MVNSNSLLDEACDSDGEVIGQESSIFAVLEFISVLGESESLQGLLLPIFPQLLCLLIVFMEITQEQVSHLQGADGSEFSTAFLPGQSLDGKCEPIC